MSNQLANILVTGGCGYKGSALIPKLLNLGYRVHVIDTQWFGNHLPSHKQLTVEKKDIRNIDQIDLTNVDAIIHLASVANDPCGELNPNSTWEIGVLATLRLVEKAIKNQVKNFLFASSGSVYGIRKESKITESLPLSPISTYSQAKMVTEKVLLSYSDQLNIQIIRPATVCGYSTRIRLDLTVNMLTAQALLYNKITVYGGNQFRPNIHIDDITDLYIFLLQNWQQISGIYNAGFENQTVTEIAETICKLVPAKICFKETQDERSYKLCSDKLLATGYKPKKTIQDAVRELINHYQHGELENTDEQYNLKWMQKKLVNERQQVF